MGWAAHPLPLSSQPWTLAASASPKTGARVVVPQCNGTRADSGHYIAFVRERGGGDGDCTDDTRVTQRKPRG
ncbi:unnamed protein product [Ectocarpus sp. 6 AP-2014]